MLQIDSGNSGIKATWDKFIPDLVMLILYFVLLDRLMAWQLKHLALSCTLLMALNIAAMALGCFSFFTGFADTKGLTRYRDSLNVFESAVMGLSAFISCLGFFWWLVPFAAAKTMGVKETGFILGATVYFIGFMGVVVKSLDNKKGLSLTKRTLFKVVNSFITTIFFFFSYSFMLMTLPHWQPSFISAPYLAIICLVAFYLPTRFFLLLRPPFHQLEYASFILSFGFLLFKLFV
jgi:hypothetical protein